MFHTNHFHKTEIHGLSDIARSNYEATISKANQEASRRIAPETYKQMKEIEKEVLSKIISRESSQDNELANWSLFEFADNPNVWILSFMLNGRSIQVEMERTFFKQKRDLNDYLCCVHEAIASGIADYMLKYVSQKQLEHEVKK